MLLMRQNNWKSNNKYYTVAFLNNLIPLMMTGLFYTSNNSNDDTHGDEKLFE